MQHPIAQRINFIIEYFTKGNVSNFAKILGFSKQTVNRIFNPDLRSGKYPIPSTELLLAICEQYPQIDANWLLIGTGEMFVGDGYGSVAAEKRVVEYDKDWKAMYEEILAERDMLNRKYVALLEKVAKP